MCAHISTAYFWVSGMLAILRWGQKSITTTSMIYMAVQFITQLILIVPFGTMLDFLFANAITMCL